MKRHAKVILNLNNQNDIQIISFGYDLAPLLMDINHRFNIKINRKYQGIMEYEIMSNTQTCHEMTNHLVEYFTTTGWEYASGKGDGSNQFQYMRLIDS
jgi:hypothetical protein